MTHPDKSLFRQTIFFNAIFTTQLRIFSKNSIFLHLYSLASDCNDKIQAKNASKRADGDS